MDADPSAPSEDMAALMGFSSFGAAPKPKKRKYSPAVENAVTDASLTIQERKQQQQQHKDYRPSSGASGGNRVPLGKGRVIRKGERNEGRSPGVVGQLNNGMLDERTEAGGLDAGKGAGRGYTVGTGGLGEGDLANSEDDGPRYVDTSSTPPPTAQAGGVGDTGTGDDDDDDDGPRYVDTSRPSPLHAVPLPAAEQAPTEDGGAGRRHSDQLVVQQQRQEPHARRWTGEEAGGGGRDGAGLAPGGGYDWRALRKGVVNRKGDVAYYDESFVENPWTELLVAVERKGAGGEGEGHG